ncbi:MAG: FAD-dependent oxidoreductase [Weeksellaceae bacterium]
MTQNTDYIYTIAIIGGGVSGVTAGLRVAELGISTLLIEQQNSVVNGPPFCHLHAGGNLYPDISKDQCVELLRQSIDMARTYPESIDKRPTFISIPKSEEYEPDDLLKRLDIIVKAYKDLIEKDTHNEVLDDPQAYYKTYTQKELEELERKKVVVEPQTLDEWMIGVAQQVDYSQLKFPVLLVNEYGWNLFRLAAQAQIALEKIEYCDLMLNTEVKNIIDHSEEDLLYNWEIETNQGTFYAQYLLNAAGYLTGEFDNDIGLEEDRLVEFKAAYVSHWQYAGSKLPELIFHGKRGTPHGMAQLTPYADGYYQIHGMTKDITLFKNGLVKSNREDAQPDLDDDFDYKLDEGWKQEDIHRRTTRAINYVAQFVPTFKNAEVGGPPLFGAQQIPGEDSSLRVAEISFPRKFYARSEIVKASSALDVADRLVEKLKELNLMDEKLSTDRNFKTLDQVPVDDIHSFAQKLASERGYAADMGKLYHASIKKA